jgi:hypothetical protein
MMKGVIKTNALKGMGDTANAIAAKLNRLVNADETSQIDSNPVIPPTIAKNEVPYFYLLVCTTFGVVLGFLLSLFLPKPIDSTKPLFNPKLNIPEQEYQEFMAQMFQNDIPTQYFSQSDTLQQTHLDLGHYFLRLKDSKNEIERASNYLEEMEKHIIYGLYLNFIEDKLTRCLNNKNVNCENVGRSIHSLTEITK